MHLIYSDNTEKSAFDLFQCKLNAPQTKYTLTELDLLLIVECQEKFKGMLWGQCIKVYRDHKNLVRDTLILSTDRAYIVGDFY